MGYLSVDPAQGRQRRPRLAACASLLLTGLVLAGCGGSDNSSVDVATVTVAPANPSISIGGTVQLTATPKDAGGNALTGLSVSWASSDPGIATVGASSGLVTGVAAGSANIVATVQGVDGTTSVTVNVPVNAVTVEPANATMSIGSTVQLVATPRDAGGNPLTGRTIAWTSSASGVASVDPSSGLVTGVAAGSATITATVEGKTGNSQITVTAVPVSSVTVDPATASIHSGTTVQLTAVPKDVGGNPLSGRIAAWTSNNTSIATVDPATGLVTGVAPGTATITATVETKTGTSAVTVGEPAFLSISAAELVSCGIITRSPGETVCWGNGDNTGALGNNGAGNNPTPGPVDPTLTFTSVSTGLGMDHVCAVSTTNVGFCWGWNMSGELGAGGVFPGLPSGAPDDVVGGLSFTAISAGNASSCGVVTGGTAYCWGVMDDGLGDASATDSSSAPVQVSGVNNFVSVSAANNFACGLTTTNKIFCWGSNDRGQLARGNTDPGPTPAEVLGNRTYTVVSARHQHACAVATNGTGYCWGPDDNGQGGSGGGVGNNTEPTPVAGNHTFSTISAGTLHACGVDTAGKAWCWGEGSNGELGSGNFNSTISPVAVAGGLTFASISAGNLITCGVTTSGDGYCWGTGILGDDAQTAQSNVPVRVAVH